MHEESPARVTAIVEVASTLIPQIISGVEASALFIAQAGSTASSIRAAAQLGSIFEDDSELRNLFEITQRTAAQMEAMAQEDANRNVKKIALTRQLESDSAALATRLAELQSPPPEQ